MNLTSDIELPSLRYPDNIMTTGMPRMSSVHVEGVPSAAGAEAITVLSHLFGSIHSMRDVQPMDPLMFSPFLISLASIFLQFLAIAGTDRVDKYQVRKGKPTLRVICQPRSVAKTLPLSANSTRRGPRAAICKYAEAAPPVKTKVEGRAFLALFTV